MRFLKEKTERKLFFFTLVEVVVALAILSISIAALLSLITASQNRLAKSYDLWRKTHILMQAAEYYMLMDLEDPPAMPEQIFPYRDFSVDVSVEDVEDLEEEYTSIPGQSPLKAMKLDLRRMSDGHIVDQIYIDRIDYENTSDNR
ncbi:MAG: type II secretion system protein [Lentisphaeria bacterium]|nr:type II secretion system protein [Lentisphaeria bacterium]